MQPLDYPFDAAVILQKKRSLRRQLLAQPGLTPKKVAILSGSTIGEIKNILELFLLNDGIRPEIYEGGYALYYENLVYDDGSLAAFAPDVIYIHTSAHNLENLPSQGDDAETAERKFETESARWQGMWAAAARFGCPVIQNNFELPNVRVMGSMDAVDVHGVVRFTNRMNAMAAEYAARTPGFYLHDLCWLAAREGLARWADASAWYAYKYAMAPQYIPVLCHSVANIIKSLFGKNKKAVVTDLDNTLWGGVIGDDGAEGIEIGMETPAGMAHAALQTYLKELSRMGILLNVCSKNEDSIARQGFARPESVLQAEDFLCFKANWQPKHENVAAIAQELNILPDSLVFLDDNPAEREIVRRELPAVAVPELTAAEEFVRVLDGAGYFEVTTLSADDRKRSEMYRQNLQRAAAQQQFGDYKDYLRSLSMRCELGAFDAPHAERITQLINKTNQFNLTTRRYTAEEIAAVMADPACITLYGRLTDKFGDNGLVTALIAQVHGEEADIVLWIMSCRVFRRDLELAVFDRLVALCRERGVRQINGVYLPTAKNLFVRDFYATIGFDKIAEEEGAVRYRFAVTDDYRPQNTVMDAVPV